MEYTFKWTGRQASRGNLIVTADTYEQALEIFRKEEEKADSTGYGVCAFDENDDGKS